MESPKWSHKKHLKPGPGSAANRFDPALWIARVMAGPQEHGTQLIPSLHHTLVLHELGDFR